MNSSSFVLWAALGCGPVLLACGDDGATPTGGSGGSGASTSDGGGGAGPGGAGGESQGGDAQGGDPTVGGGGEGGGGTSLITAAITESALYGNCKPEIGPDPVGGTFTVDYDNGGAADGTLTVVGAELSLDGIDATLTWSFDVDPATSGAVAAGDTATVIHSKVADSGSGDKGDLTPCGYCGAPGTLTVRFTDEDGAGASADFEVMKFGCAF